VPLDLVIFMLGSNDLKLKFNPTPESICARMGALLDLAKEILAQPPAHKTEILLMAPVIPKPAHVYEDFQYPELEENAKRVAALYAELARDKGVHFFDGSKTLEASNQDGAHLEAATHLKFAEVMAREVARILKGR
jgi:lysophospholipase L1-like esterase